MAAKLIKRTLKLDGLTCTACETKIEHKLKKLQGVVEADVSYVTSILYLTYDESKINLNDIIKTIEKLDYTVVDDLTEESKKEKKEKKVEKAKKENNSETSFWVVAGIIIAGLYLIVKHTVGFNYAPIINDDMGYGILLVIGMLTSLHCVAMCGGINLSVCVSYKFEKENNSKFSKLYPSFLYNAGRVLSYTILGGVIGALGSVISITNTGKAVVSILAGIFMVIMGINMLNIFPWLRRFNPHMPKIFAKKIYSQKQNKGPFIVGMLNGLMPCGPLQAMQIYALGTGSFAAGALSMFLFSLGTVPLMFGFGALGSLLSAKFTKKMVKISAVLVVVLGFVMFNRGLAFTGFTFQALAADSSESAKNTASVTSDGNVQKITTNLESGKYTPITVQAGVPVEWTIVAEKGTINGCNNEIIIPEYDIEQELKTGENVIKFTPTETGSFGYSCWMGMIRSSITVKDDLGGKDAGVSDEEDATADIDNSGLPQGCCGY